MTRLVLLTIAALMLAACAYVTPQDQAATPAQEPASVKRMTLADSGAKLKLNMGEEFEIALVDNPSTGYGWGVVAGVDDAGTPGRSEVLSTIVAFHPQRASDDGEPPPPGAPSDVIWRFRAIRSGNGTLRLQYRHLWEQSAAPTPAREAVYRIEVSEPSDLEGVPMATAASESSPL